MLELIFSDSFFKNLKSLEKNLKLYIRMYVYVFKIASIWELKSFIMRSLERLLHLYIPLYQIWASLVTQLVKNLPAMRETRVPSVDLEDHREGNGYPLQYSCLENPRDGGA